MFDLAGVGVYPHDAVAAFVASRDVQITFPIEREALRTAKSPDERFDLPVNIDGVDEIVTRESGR